MSGYEHDHCEIQLQQAVEKAVREEREAAEEVCETWKSRHAIVKERADKAERELAEMRQILLDERVQATKGAWAASEMQKRVEGLQALIDKQAAEIAKLAGEADAEFYRGQRNAVENPDGPIALMLESLTAQLAEERAKRQATEDQEKERAEKAEARVAELEAWRTAQKEWEDIAVRTMTGLQTENAELQALVDAATLRLSKLVDALGKGRMRPRA